MLLLDLLFERPAVKMFYPVVLFVVIVHVGWIGYCVFIVVCVYIIYSLFSCNVYTNMLLLLCLLFLCTVYTNYCCALFGRPAMKMKVP